MKHKFHYFGAVPAIAANEYKMKIWIYLTFVVGAYLNLSGQKSRIC